VDREGSPKAEKMTPAAGSVSGAVLAEEADIREMLQDQGYKSIIDLLPCYLSIQDPSLRILFANEGFRREFGEWKGLHCYEVYKRSAEKCQACPVQKTFQDGKTHISEETVTLSNGQPAQMIVYSAPIPDISGRVRAVIELSTNITRVKDVQKGFTFLGQSIAYLSHDIKNILEGLQGGAYVVEEGIKDNDMVLAGQGWKIVRKNIVEISTITQNILYSAKERTLKYETVSPDELVKDAVALFQEKAESMDVRLQHRVNPMLPMVPLDPLNIRRMLNNLIWNGLEACKKDKEKPYHVVNVRTDFIDRLHFKFEVEDNGVGMDDTTRENIFKESYSTKGSGGTGLGLLVVDRIVKEHGGRIEVLTTPGKGSTFRVILRLR
jgi:signal transduction histidine kinase